jgi:hypothetical protein
MQHEVARCSFGILIYWRKVVHEQFSGTIPEQIDSFELVSMEVVKQRFQKRRNSATTYTAGRAT